MNLLFDFTVDKATKTIHITREFAADLDLVWDVFTKAEMLDQWGAPKPWRSQTKEMDFREQTLQTNATAVSMLDRVVIPR